MTGPSLAAVILAGGRGTRMGGVVKPLLVRPDGVTLLAALEAALEGRAPERVVLVSPYTEEKVRAATARPVLLDPGRGPAAALLVAAEALAADWMLMVAGDQPVPPPAALLDRLAARAPGHDAVAVRAGGKRQPIDAIYRRAAVLDVARETGDRLEGWPLQRLLDRLKTAVIDESELSAEELAAFENVNTWADAERRGLRLSELP